VDVGRRYRNAWLSSSAVAKNKPLVVPGDATARRHGLAYLRGSILDPVWARRPT
jgi:hypothetical protein